MKMMKKVILWQKLPPSFTVLSLTSIELFSVYSTAVHGFKSLTTSRMVPRFTRPVTDMVDGLW